jgi:hypothetical protein
LEDIDELDGQWASRFSTRILGPLSNVPVVATVASTSNFIVHPTGVTLKTGTPEGVWAQVAGANENKRDVRRQQELVAYPAA